MSGWWRRLARDLTGRADEVFFTALQGQVEATVAAIEALEAAVDADDASGLPESVASHEEEGDAHRAELVQALTRALTTPADREDLFRVSRSIDDVLDNLRDFAREYQLYAPGARHELYPPLLEALREGMRGLDDAIAALQDPHTDALSEARRAKAAGNQLRRCFEEQIAGLFDGALTMDTLKHRELLRRLDVAGLRLGEAADALSDGALKRTS